MSKTPTTNPDTTGWQTCRIGSCQHHQGCQYMPCRNAGSDDRLTKTTSRPIFTPYQIDQAIHLRETEQKSLRTIAATLKISSSAIQWHFLRAGVDTPKKFRKSSPASHLPLNYIRNGRIVRRFSPDEDRIIESMSLDGCTITEIGRHLDPPRRAHTIVTRLLFLARRDARTDGD